VQSPYARVEIAKQFFFLGTQLGFLAHRSALSESYTLVAPPDRRLAPSIQKQIRLAVKPMRQRMFKQVVIVLIRLHTLGGRVRIGAGW
jgi:hypothetical protein